MTGPSVGLEHLTSTRLFSGFLTFPLFMGALCFQEVFPAARPCGAAVQEVTGVPGGNVSWWLV